MLINGEQESVLTHKINKQVRTQIKDKMLRDLWQKDMDMTKPGEIIQKIKRKHVLMHHRDDMEVKQIVSSVPSSPIKPIVFGGKK
jgi:hypothetical protein